MSGGEGIAAFYRVHGLFSKGLFPHPLINDLAAAVADKADGLKGIAGNLFPFGEEGSNCIFGHGKKGGRAKVRIKIPAFKAVAGFGHRLRLGKFAAPSRCNRAFRRWRSAVGIEGNDEVTYAVRAVFALMPVSSPLINQLPFSPMVISFFGPLMSSLLTILRLGSRNTIFPAAALNGSLDQKTGWP